MTEPSDDQIIADAMLLGGEFEGEDLMYSCTIPGANSSMFYKFRARAAYWALHHAGYHYVDGTLTKRR
ncbi:hypothetical protein CWO91_16695 [Bradyrhizobium genosp. SA-3]|uniref:hypothetical protein n=1 Tax=Bradyrhizobium genosp. SA-3 TaxID=508868 RepID=UPI0010295DA1|nr:hypothetical protein [Bradyrhizobium genosp. SA-3]RZN09666.1 hypothetical protein CWO91_16695 [Bradyrhizobium genosp. SA-3]